MNAQISPKRYLRPSEVCSEYNLTMSLLRKLIGKGRIPTIRPAGSRIVLIPRQALEKMMEEGE